MRTVPFSSPAIQKTLKSRFICARVNTTGEPTAGASFSHAPSDPPGPCLRGNGRQNIQLLFLTPGGELFHALTGYVGPEDLAEELTFALETYEALQSQHDDREQIVRDAHTERLQSLGYNEAQIHQTGDDPIGGMLAGMAGIAPALARGEFAPGEMLDGLARGQVLSDYRFAIRHPLLPWKRFKPAMLVGQGKSFFGSTSSGISGGGRHGN
ncbi:MAG TPA: hypothetical protein VGX78_19710 [Pirellulales bacterium]|jgi:hypothetical protein|nr:hypothetical protein [Pirellulales bacterium]